MRYLWGCGLSISRTQCRRHLQWAGGGGEPALRAGAAGRRCGSARRAPSGPAPLAGATRLQLQVLPLALMGGRRLLGYGQA